MTSTDAPSLRNDEGLYLFVMMTCLNGYFQDSASDSLAEALLKANGGAVAAWASSGMTLHHDQAAMKQAFYRVILNTVGLKPLTLGEAARAAKLAVPNIDARRSWVLLGDPTITLNDR